MGKFIHADLIAQYLQDANETDEPWLRWRYMACDQWIDATDPIAFYPEYRYSRKPKTILINGFEVPEPVREPLAEGQAYWLANPTEDTAQEYAREGNVIDLHWLAAGLIHLTKEAAQTHIDALLSFTRRGE